MIGDKLKLSFQYTSKTNPTQLSLNYVFYLTHCVLYATIHTTKYKGFKMMRNDCRVFEMTRDMDKAKVLGLEKAIEIATLDILESNIDMVTSIIEGWEETIKEIKSKYKKWI